MPEVATRESRAGWKTVAFGDVARQVKDKVDPEESGLERYVAGEHMDTDDLRIRRWGEIGDGYLGPAFHMRFKPGHVLYGSRRTYLRKVAIADFEGITANTTYVLESADHEVLLPELLPFIMQTEAFSQHSIRESKGSVNPYVNFSDLAWFEFALPPITAQRRMVQLARAVEDACESNYKLQCEVERAYLSLLVEIFGLARKSGESGSVAVDARGVEWKHTRVEEHFELQLGKMSSAKAREGQDHSRYIKNNNVLWDDFSLEDLPEMHYSKSEKLKFSLHPGDLLVCEGGEIGRAAVWRSANSDIYYQKALHRLRSKDGSSTRFMMHYMRACAEFGILEKVATGSTMLHLPRERLAGLLLPFPSPDWQAKYAAQADSTGGAVWQCKRRLHDVRSLKKAVLLELSQ